MPARISRVRIINRKTAQHTPVDPAQSGAFYARLAESGRLTITGIRGQIMFRADGVLAARWEDEETILLVIREEAEDEPVAVRAFQPRTRREWETEDAHATPHVSPDGRYIALELQMPNPAVAVLPAGKVAREPLARVNLGAPPESVEWLDDDKSLLVTAGGVRQQWMPGARQFVRVKE